MASLAENDGALQIAIYSLGFFYSCYLQLRETLGGPCMNYLKKGTNSSGSCMHCIGGLYVLMFLLLLLLLVSFLSSSTNFDPTLSCQVVVDRLESIRNRAPDQKGQTAAGDKPWNENKNYDLASPFIKSLTWVCSVFALLQNWVWFENEALGLSKWGALKYSGEVNFVLFPTRVINTHAHHSNSTICHQSYCKVSAPQKMCPFCNIW